MQNISLEKFYKRIKKHIALVAAYTEQPYLEFVIRSGRLKPYSLFDGTLKYITNLESKWVDEFGNSLILNDKIPYIILNDCSVGINTQIKTDLLQNISIDDYSIISKLYYEVSGLEEDFLSPVNMKAFLGEDNYIRCFIRAYDELSICSPLLLGLDALKSIYERLNTTTPIEINSPQFPLPCQNLKAWIKPIKQGEKHS